MCNGLGRLSRSDTEESYYSGLRHVWEYWHLKSEKWLLRLKTYSSALYGMYSDYRKLKQSSQQSCSNLNVQSAGLEGDRDQRSSSWWALEQFLRPQWGASYGMGALGGWGWGWSLKMPLLTGKDDKEGKGKGKWAVWRESGHDFLVSARKGWQQANAFCKQGVGMVVMGWWLVILEVFSKLNDSVILRKPMWSQIPSTVE